MSKLLAAILALGAVLAIGIPTGMKIINSDKSVETINKTYTPINVPSLESPLESSDPVKIYDVKKIITLESANTVVFRGPVTSDSVSQVMLKLRKISRSISKNTPIYLVIDSPGGSVFDGLAFIDYTKALPQKVHTITLFGASMAFIIAQHLDTRYMPTNGTMMSHRARGGVQGQFNGELETRYKMVKRALDYIDYKISKRMGLSIKNYKALIKDEYWVHGFDAVQDRAADEQILIRCGNSLDGTESVKLRSFFGTINAEFSKCPLIKAPISVAFKAPNKKNLNYLKYLNRISFQDKSQFIKDMIDTDKIGTVFPIR